MSGKSVSFFSFCFPFRAADLGLKAGDIELISSTEKELKLQLGELAAGCPL